MTPTKRDVTNSEWHECSSDKCTSCKEQFYVMASGWSVSIGYECPFCGELVKHSLLRKARQQ